jgi:hypothetical protein
VAGTGSHLGPDKNRQVEARGQFKEDLAFLVIAMFGYGKTVQAGLSGGG